MASQLTLNGAGSVRSVVLEMAPPPPPPLPPRGTILSKSESPSTAPEELSDEISPLLPQIERQNHKMNIFTVPYPRRKPRDPVARLVDADTSGIPNLISWIWSGSRYSGVVCMVFSSSVFYLMSAISEAFTVQQIPLLQTAFTRCTIVFLLSFYWLRRSGQPVFGPANVKRLLFSRAILGCISMMSFIYWSYHYLSTFIGYGPHTLPILFSFMRKGQSSYEKIEQRAKPTSNPAILKFFFWMNPGFISSTVWLLHVRRLPLSQSIVLSFSSPILASAMARVVLLEKLRIAEIGGLACSFFGVLFIFLPVFASGDDLIKLGASTQINVTESHHIYPILIGLLSLITSGASTCLIRAGAKASDQPICTVFLFGLLASLTAAVSTFFLEEFVFPSFYSLILMVTLGVLGFLAEVLSARGLHLEKISKVSNIQYTEVALSQLWGVAASTISPSFGRLSGCLLILVSVCCTIVFGPEKETE